jgi:prophage maintenance system killer protein
MKNNKQIIIYKDKAGKTDIKININKGTIWLSQKQIALLFDTQRPAITKHLSNIFKSNELDEKEVSSILEHTTKHGAMAGKTQTKKVKYYNLDAIISIGYRVNSKKATEFRKWATTILRHHLVDGYTINEKRLLEEKKKFSDLKEAIGFIEKQSDHYLLQGKTRELLSLIGDYSESLSLLRQYDEGKIKIESVSKPVYKITYQKCKSIIKSISIELVAKKEAGKLFGIEVNNKLKSIIGAIDQTFDGVNLYKSVEEKAANLLYLVIKDHPFSDGNKRIAAILFVYFLKMNNYLYKNHIRKISNNALVSLALLVATSDPKDKKLLVNMIMSLIQ